MVKRIVKRNGELSKPIGPGKANPKSRTMKKGMPGRNSDAIAHMKEVLAAGGILTTRPAWRPSTYRPEYCEQIIEFCAKGHSLRSFAGEIEVPAATMLQWGAAHPEFQAALEVAKQKALIHHERFGIKISERGERGTGQASMNRFFLQVHGRDEFAISGPAVVVNNNVVTSNQISGMNSQQAMDAFRAALRGDPLPKTIEGTINADGQDDGRDD